MNRYKKVGIIIPARYESTRLPGKPLLDLCGKTMIQRTWEQCVKALPSSQVYIATDDTRIAEHVASFGGEWIMTSSACLTGTDRIAEANLTLDLDLVINVQGDEPIVDPKEIIEVIDFAQENPGCVINAVAEITKPEEYSSTSIPKVVMTEDDDLLYMSRSPIPGSKEATFHSAFKQICIYGFPRDALEMFASCTAKSRFELQEDIEILRFLEKGTAVKLVRVTGQSMAVDTEADVQRVREIIYNRQL